MGKLLIAKAVVISDILEFVPVPDGLSDGRDIGAAFSRHRGSKEFPFGS
jgi:hypothetical protein